MAQSETNMVFISQITVSEYNQNNKMRYEKDRTWIAANIIGEKL